MGCSMIVPGMPSMTPPTKDQILKQQELDFRFAVKLQLEEIKEAIKEAKSDVDINQFKINDEQRDAFNEKNKDLAEHFSVESFKSDDILAIIIAKSISTSYKPPSSQVPKVELDLKPVQDVVKKIQENLFPRPSLSTPTSGYDPSQIRPVSKELRFPDTLPTRTTRWLTDNDIKYRIAELPSPKPQVAFIGVNANSEGYFSSLVKQRQLELVKLHLCRVLKSNSSNTSPEFTQAYNRLFANSSSASQEMLMRYISSEQNNLVYDFNTVFGSENLKYLPILDFTQISNILNSELEVDQDMHLFINKGANQRLDSRGVHIQDGSHWVYAMLRFNEADLTEYTVYYKDSFGNAPDPNLFKINAQMKPTVYYNDEVQQTDTVSCGLWALENFKTVAGTIVKDLPRLFPISFPIST
jgi:hypothetical protein